MAYSSVSIPIPHIAVRSSGSLGENYSLCRSSSNEELCKQAPMRRSYSDNHLLNSYTHLRVSSTRSNKLKISHSFGTLPHQFSNSNIHSPARSLLLDTKVENDMLDDDDDDDDYLENGPIKEDVGKERVTRRINWVEKLVELKVQWKSRRENKKMKGYKEKEEDDGEDGCPVDYGERTEEEEMVKIDSNAFSKFLIQVPWSDANRFSKLATLSNKAYKIPEIKAQDLQHQYGLHFVTSSLGKKAEAIALKTNLDKDSTHLQEDTVTTVISDSQRFSLKQERTSRPNIAYEIAASAASHVQCQARNESRKCVQGDGDHTREEVCRSEVAAQMAASTMMAVVAAREREKQEAAIELQSLHSSPCEWFTCDAPCTHVRYFVIQGSESLTAWQTNLFFEPAKFEDTDALVHRGIYEAAKGLFEQFRPEIESHIKTHGDDAKFQFTGHSLGGSLSLLVHLMLIARGVVKSSTLLPVVTFGSPFVFCGGQKVLEHLGLDENQAHCVILHRDIVPRAFSCNYPRHVAQVLKRLNGSFQSHPCLTKHRTLYSPLGQIFILQPMEKSSPSHPLLPPGCGLYIFYNTQHNSAAVALRAFLNNPHPLETLSNPKAYGSKGSILRDHESQNYAKVVSSVTREYTRIAFRQVKRERQLIWPLIGSPTQHTWDREGNLVNKVSARKEIMTSV